MTGFGLARIMAEGSPMHPDDITWECECEKCQARFAAQAKAYFDWWRAHGRSEKDMSEEPYYIAP